MKIRRIFQAGLLLAAFAACKNETEKPDNTVPACILAKVEAFKEQAPCEESAGVYEYSFEGQLVYAFRDGDCCCDFGTAIYNAQCEQICFLEGIAGLSSCLGKPFFENASLTKTIWED